ncbi:pantoate--beta-alanine ligase [Geobacter sulfurreducens]|jgi:pantoate--beta-alanine ligase|uniref:Pantothenate synthetase n=1 Tax=Geobacter sulfurreducens (strain ATCC 51573 / DSM 12127 / PCA) TaxID=243231 RepID=PANC_GEOSL|nr:pantoate--beta-alanine ligase [Geobacter sulfurreducens]Q74CG7.1 RecName: Full=Pantothenate synthetase; Short=PS; AltName: Full=Pantoate--beta-alanine ligase; AltName: Full=Pantoate-activating enzyme [Geobacter sulfurreducens PCA]AAR35084.1 pantoate--beta-alanine ligase [Geobacter sulfurreducens PCA]ADI84543.1 pantoate--beta-alanine ligase [Geobacter sulfurreducens KN400]AJY71412.1 pantoate--beta-alanine ligase [Geobacter sulfurreducens]QVW36862.1 pantoate--beta-alanine ligase [Geobacter su
MRIIDSVADMQAFSRDARRSGKTIALVPTMGYLHDGHASLMREGRTRADILVVSIFVNPTQFGPNEDFTTYPRDLERDLQVAEAAGADVIFAPRADDMYPAGFQTYVDVEKVTLPLCGASRPGHFRGVTTVVAKLFNIVMPHTAFFGKKDFQQLAVIRRMVADLNMDLSIVGMPIIREPDGLAMSSRNAYLGPQERTNALCLNRSLAAARTLFTDGERSVARLRDTVLRILTEVPGAAIDYADFRDSETLEPVEAANEKTLLALAVKIGTTRLIDNCVLGEEQ